MLSSRENKPVALSREAGIIWKKLHKIKTKLTKGKKNKKCLKWKKNKIAPSLISYDHFIRYQVTEENKTKKN